ncbi:MAG TPA: hypothetical protein VIG42_02370, partial [Solirubrobacteraceae bacterium]
MSFARSPALALVACACLASGAHAAPVAKLRVSFDPDIAGGRTTIRLALRVRGSGGATPSPLRSLALRLPPGMGIATSTLGQANCEPARLIHGGLRGCSENARVGRGEATAVVPVGATSLPEKASLDALMGPAREDRLEVLFYVQALSPVFAQLVFASVVEEDRLPYGEQLDASIPLIQAWPEGPDMALEAFAFSIGPAGLTYHRQVNGRTVSYRPRGVRLPRSCPRGGFPFGALLSFQDGTHESAVYHVPCP